MRVVLLSLFDVIHVDVLFQSNFVPLWHILCDYTVFKNSYTSRYLLWSSLSTITVIFNWCLWRFSGNCQRRRPFSASSNNVFLQIFSLVESFCIEMKVLLPATLQKELPQLSFLGISRILFKMYLNPIKYLRWSLLQK